MTMDIGDLIQNVATSRLFHAVSALINRLPFPYSKLRLGIQGFRMSAHTFDRYLALWFLKLGLTDPFQSKLVATLCKPGMFTLDIGANLGYYSLLMAKYVGDSGSVWAFEPDPGNYAMLKQNLEYNHISNARALNLALNSSSGKGNLYISSSHGGDHRIYQSDHHTQVIQVTMVMLDEFLPIDQRVDFIKMDIQGAEGIALAGMKRILQSNPGLKLLFEFWPMGIRQTGFDPEKVLSDLVDYGFKLEVIDEEAENLAEIENPILLVNSLQGNKQVNLLATWMSKNG